MSMDLKGKKIVLGLSGGVACYKAAELCRALTKQGASVQVVMTEAATHFIGTVTMQALSGRGVYTDQWDGRIPNNMAHIDLTRDADAILVAPCSADFLFKLAHGATDDLLSTLCLARPHQVPLLVAPAMNVEMWEKPPTQRNVAQLRQDGIRILGPAAGSRIRTPSWRSCATLRWVGGFSHISTFMAGATSSGTPCGRARHRVESRSSVA